MPSPDRGVAHGLRALALTAGSLAVTAVGHSAAGGVFHPTPGLAVVGVALLALTFVLTERRRGFGVIAFVMLATQPMLHVAMGLGGHGAADPAPGLGGASNGIPMVAAHVVAAAGCSWLLAHGEALLWRAYEGLYRSIPSSLPPCRVLPGLLAGYLEPALERTRVFMAAAPSRGPPPVALLAR